MTSSRTNQARLGESGGGCCEVSRAVWAGHSTWSSVRLVGLCGLRGLRSRRRHAFTVDYLIRECTHAAEAFHLLLRDSRHDSRCASRSPGRKLILGAQAESRRLANLPASSDLYSCAGPAITQPTADCCSVFGVRALGGRRLGTSAPMSRPRSEFRLPLTQHTASTLRASTLTHTPPHLRLGRQSLLHHPCNSSRHSHPQSTVQNPPAAAGLREQQQQPTAPIV